MKLTAGNIAIITTDLAYYNASVCSGLYSEFQKNGYSTQIYLTFENQEKEKENIYLVLNDKNLKGIVLFSCMSNPAFYQDIFQKLNIPCVFADRLIPYLSQSNFVTVDNYGGAYKIGKLLIEKGAKNIVCLSILKDNHISTIEDRINGFKDSHIHLNNINCYREELEYPHINKSMEHILSKWENNNTFPDAIFATNHLIMNAFISLTQQNKTWQNLSKHTILSCFDNLPYFDWINRPIISVDQPIKDITFYISSILLKRIKEPETNANVSNLILPVKIIDRTK
ncbi:MAG: substrate-binding domain-containing protein [Bacteroidia bacterium]|nr:substrate-binding domain-containing protein [Bacteroidia bacterium]